MATKLTHSSKCPDCGKVCDVRKVYKDRANRFHHFRCECGKTWAEAWQLDWPNVWRRMSHA